LILLLNLALKSLYLSRGDISLDEPFTIFYAQQDLPSLLGMLSTENNPPLWFLVLHGWIRIFGMSVFSVRFLPMLCSSLTAVVLYFTGKNFFNLRTGLLASLLFTFSGYSLLFSHEARVYALFGGLTAVSFYLFFRLYKTPGRSLFSAWPLALANLLLVYSHFFGFLVIGVQAACLAASREARTRLAGPFLASVAADLLLYLPYAGILWSRFHASAGGTWIPEPSLTGLYNNLWKFSNAPVVTVLLLSVLALAAGKFFYLKIRNRKSPGIPVMTRFVLIWFFVPYFGMFLFSYILPVFFDRYLVFISIGYYLLVALAAEFIGWNAVSRTFLAVLLAGAMLVTFDPAATNGRKPREMAALLQTLRTPGTAVILCPAWTDLQVAWYLDPPAFRDYRNTRQRLMRESIFPVNTAEELGDSLTASATRIIYVDGWAELTDPGHTVQRRLEAAFPNCERVAEYPGYTVYRYSR
jgi:uncharacterized membrane protein